VLYSDIALLVYLQANKLGLGPPFDHLHPPPAHTGMPGLSLLSLDKSGRFPGYTVAAPTTTNS